MLIDQDDADIFSDAVKFLENPSLDVRDNGLAACGDGLEHIAATNGAVHVARSCA
jgi:hypothetical protein